MSTDDNARELIKPTFVGALRDLCINGLSFKELCDLLKAHLRFSETNRSRVHVGTEEPPAKDYRWFREDENGNHMEIYKWDAEKNQWLPIVTGPDALNGINKSPGIIWFFNPEQDLTDMPCGWKLVEDEDCQKKFTSRDVNGRITCSLIVKK